MSHGESASDPRLEQALEAAKEDPRQMTVDEAIHLAELEGDGPRAKQRNAVRDVVARKLTKGKG